MGVTYVTLAPEHPLVSSITTSEQKETVDSYVKKTSSRSDMDRTSSKEKTGVFTGGYVTHPVSGDRVPVWVGDYVLGSYGTGAVMAVPAHDTRDFEFAQKFDLDIKWVVKPKDGEFSKEVAFIEPGVAMNSGDFDGLSTDECKKARRNQKGWRSDNVQASRLGVLATTLLG
jgi:leucyl-tRNA synthetase